MPAARRLVLPFALAAAALLAACDRSPYLPTGAAAVSAPNARVAGARSGCNAAAAQFTVARIADDALAAQAQEKAGAASVRIVREGESVTQDNDPSRLTLEVGGFERVRAARCG